MFLGKKPELWTPLRSRWRSRWSHGAQPGQQMKCGLKTLGVRKRRMVKPTAMPAVLRVLRGGGEGNLVGEGTTRRGTATPVHRPQRPAGSTHSSTRGLRPPEQLESLRPLDCSLPGSSVRGILQARILEWVAFPFSRGYSQPRDRTQVSHIAWTPDFPGAT